MTKKTLIHGIDCRGFMFRIKKKPFSVARVNSAYGGMRFRA